VAYTYDALSRMTARGPTTYSYNGDGTLVSQASGGVTTLYTQDLAAPLSQVLQTRVGSATRTDYLYGLTRLASLNGSTKTWYVADALGSVRRTVADSGTPLGIVNYDDTFAGVPEQSQTLVIHNPSFCERPVQGLCRGCIDKTRPISGLLSAASSVVYWQTMGLRSPIFTGRERANVGIFRKEQSHG
jgi:hypothetical protein